MVGALGRGGVGQAETESPIGRASADDVETNAIRRRLFADSRDSFTRMVYALTTLHPDKYWSPSGAANEEVGYVTLGANGCRRNAP